jgi:outer membrane protein OmpA-like peptidoglycan-associated protein
MLRHRILWTCVAMTLAGPALADDAAGREEGIGMLSGAATGALVGGPVGAMVGVMVGGLFGERVRIAAQASARADELAADVDESRTALRAASLRIAALEENRLLDDLADRLSADVLFRTGSDALEPQVERRLGELAGVLAQIEGARVELHGFADPRGGDTFNRDLSERRARRVQSVLATGGLDPTRTVIVAHGEAESTALPGDADAYAWERRVTLNLVGATGQSLAQLE